MFPTYTWYFHKDLTGKKNGLTLWMSLNGLVLLDAQRRNVSTQSSCLIRPADKICLFDLVHRSHNSFCASFSWKILIQYLTVSTVPSLPAIKSTQQIWCYKRIAALFQSNFQKYRHTPPYGAPDLRTGVLNIIPAVQITDQEYCSNGIWVRLHCHEILVTSARTDF